MTYREPTAIDAVANQHFATTLSLSPESRTFTGLGDADPAGFDDQSPEGLEKRYDVDRQTLSALAALEPADDVDAVTKAAMNERLGLSLEMHEAGEDGHIDVISTPLQGVREIFDLMGQETAEDWELIVARLGNVRGALEGWKQTLALRAERGPKIAARQIERNIDQAAKAAGAESAFVKLAALGAAAQPELASALEANAKDAQAAYGELSEFLRETMAPAATPEDGVGRERYQRFSREFLGATVDLDETYEWGREELANIVAEQERIAEELYGPGVSVTEAMDRLNKEPRYALKGTKALQEWMQGLADEAVAALSETHFDIPDPVKKIECMIAPSGTGGIYYTNPTDDFSRPGRMWWSVPDGVEDFATWQERTTVYHEGVPGHHLQIGTAVYERESLNDWRRMDCWTSGHGEGWALYAEQLMGELGFQDDPGNRMGMLDGSRLRAARVVLDIGVHLGKPTFGDYAQISPTWNADVAWQFLQDNVAMERSFLAFELDRYLGWPGQAPSYKVGQRIWNEARESARAAAGDAFDLKDWHGRALRLGSLPLDVMLEALK